jgi:hypothetical protein
MNQNLSSGTGGQDESKKNQQDHDKERHDQLSRDIRLTGIVLYTYSIFCFVTLSQVDEIIKTRNIEIPLAEFPIKFSSFLTVGPVVLLIITFYLHLFIWEWKSIRTIKPGKKLPFTFNMENPPAKMLSNVIFYILPPLVLLFFSYRAYVWAIDLIDIWGMAALICFGVLGVIWFFHIEKEPSRNFWNTLFPLKIRQGFVLGYVVIGCVVSVLAITGKLNQMFPLDLVRAELSEQKVARLNLNNANFFAANLKDTTFLQTSLQGANLEQADLERADLQRVNLKEAKFRNANLHGANLKRANLREANLRAANLEEANLEMVDLRDANLGRANLKGAIIVATNLTGAKNLTCEQLKSADVQKFLQFGSKKRETRLPMSLEIIWDADGKIKECFQGQPQ